MLGLSQSRKGPNKVRVGGFLQPISDAVKLFIKELEGPAVKSFLFLLAPGGALFIMLAVWQILPLPHSGARLDYSLLPLLVVLRLGLYPLLLAGWASNSKYSLIGALRGVAQTISYEIRLAILLLAVVFLSGSLTLSA